MFPSESEIDTRLSELRRQRDVIEREIADLVLYRELGRRFGESEPRGPAGPNAGHPILASQERPVEPVTENRTDRFASVTALRSDPPTGSMPLTGGSDATATGTRDIPSARHPSPDRRSPSIPPVAFEDDPVAARRYGRAILEAALDGLREAGRPLHAGEILERVIARGFTVPGQDPVAALNTRLWKRSGPGGPLRRLGDAVYALAEPPSE